MKTLERWLMSLSERTPRVVLILMLFVLGFLAMRAVSLVYHAIGLVGVKAGIMSILLAAYLLWRHLMSNEAPK